MNLEGTYIFYELNAKLVITSADNHDGQGEGIFVLGGMEIPVGIQFHFKDSIDPETTLEIHGWNNDPNQYVGAAGSTSIANNFAEINLAGGVATIDNVISFGGKFVRPDYE
jgi:hypothetical protein